MTLPALRHGACHCQAVRFEVALPDDLSAPRRCNCSICRMRGAVTVTAKLGGFRVMVGEALLTEYRFNTRAARHYFCSRCGIYTHHQRRSNTEEYGVNAACLEGVSPFDFPEVSVVDGANHHPGDTGLPAQLAGILRYER